MTMLYIDWASGKVERQYRGARTIRFVKHMNRESIQRLCDELNDLSNRGYHPTKWGSGWLYQKGASAA